MKISKILSALSLAFALQAGALIAATADLAPSATVAAVSKKKKNAKPMGFGPQTITTVKVG